MAKPLILVSNDDGITSHGIRTLVDVMCELGEVVVVAPDSPQSGMGHAITIGNTLRLDEVDIFKVARSYKCSGTPADCVKLAKHQILKDKICPPLAFHFVIIPPKQTFPMSPTMFTKLPSRHCVTVCQKTRP